MEDLLRPDLIEGDHFSTSDLFSKSGGQQEGSEEDVFTKYSPLPRLFYLSIGPLISQIVLSLNGFIDSYWVAKTLGEEGLAVFGAVFVVDFIATAVGEYLITGLSARASYLFGQQEPVQCAQMFVDFIRIAFLAAILVPLVVIPITRPLIEWFGGDKNFSWQCLEFMIPATCGSFSTFLYMIVCGQAQAEGESVRYGLLQLTALVFDQGVFNPLFLVYFKTPIWGASLARICAEGISAIIGLGLIFVGKAKISPDISMFANRISREAWAAMKIGFASFITVWSETLPMVLMQKYVNDAATSIGAYEPVVEVWGLLEKLYQFVSGICVAFSLGMLPSTAWAFGARLQKDLMKTSLHMLWITTIISALLSSVLVLWPTRVASIWSVDSDFLKWAQAMVPKTFYMGPALGMLFMVPVLYEAMQKYWPSTILAFITQFFPLPVFSTILHFLRKDDPAMVVWAYCLTDGFAFVICTTFFLVQLVIFIRTPATVEEIMMRTTARREMSDPGPQASVGYVDTD